MTAGRPRTYTPQVIRIVGSVIRRTQSLRKAQRVLAEEYDGPWGENGPAMKTLREIYQKMPNPPELSDVGGRPPTYTDEQKEEMARLAARYGVTGQQGAMAILRARNGTKLAGLRKAKIFPKPVRVSQPTITEASRIYVAD